MPQAEETYLSLRIYYADLDPDEITRDLALTPTSAHRRGDHRPSKSSKVFAPYDNGLWSLSTQGTVKSTELDDHLNALFKLLSGKEASFERYRKDGYKMDIFVFWTMADAIGGGPLLSWRHAEKLHAFKLDLLFDVYS